MYVKELLYFIKPQWFPIIRNKFVTSRVYERIDCELNRLAISFSASVNVDTYRQVYKLIEKSYKKCLMISNDIKDNSRLNKRFRDVN